MKGLFVLADESQSIAEALSYQGGELVVLVVMDRDTLATDFDSELKALEKRGQEIGTHLRKRGVKCSVQVEWGDKTSAIGNALLREAATLVNKV
jgi:hypothetical protein